MIHYSVRVSVAPVYLRATMSTPARKRLMRDFKRLQHDPPAGISGAPQDNNIMLWNAVIFGYFSALLLFVASTSFLLGFIWGFHPCFRSLLCYRQKCSFLALNTEEQRTWSTFVLFVLVSREEEQVYDSNPFIDCKFKHILDIVGWILEFLNQKVGSLDHLIWAKQM